MDNRERRLLECLERRKQKLEIVEQSKKGVGKSAYVKCLKGETLTQSQAIQAMCYECMGYYKPKRCRKNCNFLSGVQATSLKVSR